jgi:hypothetical protein
MSEATKRSTNAKRRLFPDEKDDQASNNAPTGRRTRSKGSTAHNLSTVVDTPQKKKAKTKHDFFSPKGKPIVTPDKFEGDEVEVVSPPLTKTRLSELFSPTKTKRVDDGPYVPTYIHKNLSYKRQGDASLSEKVVKTFELVKEHYEIPDDFESNRSFGPLSGTSYEERAITAYNLSMLDPKNADRVEICSNCVSVGHKRGDCPRLI